MSHDALKSLLVSLDFDINDGARQNFAGALNAITGLINQLDEAMGSSVGKVFSFTTQVAAHLDKLYTQAQNSHASVAGIQSLDYAFLQTGSDAGVAQAALQNLANFVQSSPLNEKAVQNLGIQTRTSSGELRDLSAVFTDVGHSLSQMPPDKATLTAARLGIDGPALSAMRQGLGDFQQQYADMTQALGFNAEQSSESAHRFTRSWQALGQLGEVAQLKVGGDLAQGLTGVSDNLFQGLIDNLPRLQPAIDTGVKGIVGLAEIFGNAALGIIQAVGDITEWWGHLDSGSRQVITALGGLVAAWAVLNSAFLVSPLGIIISLVAAVGLLVNDFHKWRSGSKSFIDWGKWQPGIDAALSGFERLLHSIKTLSNAALKLLGIDPNKWSLKWDLNNAMMQLGELGKMLDTIADLLNAVSQSRWDDAIKFGKKLLNLEQEPSAEAKENPASANPRQAAFSGMALRPPISQAAPGFQDWSLIGLKSPLPPRPAGSIGELMQRIEATGANAMRLPQVPEMARSLSNPVRVTQLNHSLNPQFNKVHSTLSPRMNPPADPARTAGIQQATTINVYGAEGHVSLGQDIANRQMGVNAHLVQQLSTRMS